MNNIIKIPDSELIDISKLKPNKTNVKKHSKQQIDGLVELIKLEGFVHPLLIDKKNKIYAATDQELDYHHTFSGDEPS